MRKPLLLALCSFVPFLLRCGGDDAASTPPPDVPAAADASDLQAAEAGTDAATAVDAGRVLPTKSPGCGKPATASPQSGVTQSVKASGVDRSFVLYVPKAYDPQRGYPVVVLYHGIDATGADMAAYIQMQDYAAGEAIVAFPTAVNGRWDTSGDRDLAFFDALLGSLETTLCVNEQRVFALGFSFGAYMVNHLGCKRSDVLRAFVAADGGFPNATGCGATAALVYHRTDDDDEPVSNGKRARDKWLGINGCASTTKPVADFGLQGLGCVQYDGCAAHAPLLWCEDTDTSPPDYKHNLRDVYRVPLWSWFRHF
jgi:polyhydroxybutyrate depolymerase